MTETEIKKAFEGWEVVKLHVIGVFQIVEYITHGNTEFQVIWNGERTYKNHSTLDKALLYCVCISSDDHDAFKYISRMLFPET